jgi:hypothetical protein
MLEGSTITNGAILRAGPIVEGVHTSNSQHGTHNTHRVEDGEHLLYRSAESGDSGVHAEPAVAWTRAGNPFSTESTFVRATNMRVQNDEGLLVCLDDSMNAEGVWAFGGGHLGIDARQWREYPGFMRRLAPNFMMTVTGAPGI